MESSALYKAILSKDASSILAAVSKPDTKLDAKDTKGQTYISLLAKSGMKCDREVWYKLLNGGSLFTRDCEGLSGLDVMLKHMTREANSILKGHMARIAKDGIASEEFGKASIMSGRIYLLIRLAKAAKADQLSDSLLECAEYEQKVISSYKKLRENDDVREIKMSFSKREELMLQDLTGLPPLQLATLYGSADVMVALLQKQPMSVNFTDSMGRTALHYACAMQKVNAKDSEEKVNALKDAGADNKCKDLNGQTPDDMTKGSFDVAKFKEENSQKYIEKHAEYTLYRIHDAVISSDIRQVKMVLDRKELATVRDASDLTALHKAVALKRTDIALWIAENFKPAINTQGLCGLTCMHLAAVIDKTLYEKLKALGGDSKAPDTEGNSAEYYKDHQSDFPIDIHELTQDLSLTPPSRPVSAAVSNQKPAKPPTTSTTGNQKPASSSLNNQSQISTARTMASNNKPAAAPETLDAKYIAEVLGAPLTAALAEVAEKRPWDPIEYLAQWLYKHKANLDYHQKQLDAVKDAERAEQMKKDEAESRARRRREAQFLKEQEEEKKRQQVEEEKKLKEQEERQKKAKESVHLAQPPELATVTEDNEDQSAAAAAEAAASPRAVVDKDEEGRTELHRLVLSNSIDEVKALLEKSGVDLLPERTIEGKNARDLSTSEEMTSTLDEYVKELFTNEKTSEIGKLLENGYPLTSLNLSADELPESTRDYVSIAGQLTEALGSLSAQIVKGDLRGVKQCIAKRAQAVARVNNDGATALHLAVLYNHPDIVKYLISSYPTTVQCRDNMNRTPLHYAYTVSEEMVQSVLSGKADEEAKDCKGRKPEELKDSDELKAAAAPTAE